MRKVPFRVFSMGFRFHLLAACLAAASCGLGFAEEPREPVLPLPPEIPETFTLPPMSDLFGSPDAGDVNPPLPEDPMPDGPMSDSVLDPGLFGPPGSEPLAMPLLEVPDFEPIPEPLPPIELFELPSADLLPLKPRPLTLGPRIEVKEFVFEGNTAFDDAELAELLKPYTGRRLDNEDLQEARQVVTSHYVEAGYVTSGAILPDQDPSDGRIRLQIVEGVLNRIQVEGNRWLRASYLRPRIRMAATKPVNMNRIRQRLQLLQQTPPVQRFNAELEPDARPGESYLKLVVHEQFPITAGVEVNNWRAPSVGEGQIDLWMVHQSLTGFADVLELRYGLLDRGFDPIEYSGLDNLLASYTFPLTPWDTTLEGRFERNSYTVVEEPFVELDIEGETSTSSVALRQPLYRSEKSTVSVRLALDVRRSQTDVLGVPFSITPGAVNGEANVTVLRLSADWTNRSRLHVFALRSTGSLGLQAFDSTDDGTERDGTYLAWLGQGQYVRRLFDTDVQLVLRGIVQLSNNPLLALEQFSIGGANTVRGYQENQLVRDMGYVASAELRVPLIRWKGVALSLAPFLDIGGGWNSVTEDQDDEYRTICSVGAGLLLQAWDRVDAQLYWGHPFTDFPDSGQGLQQDGIHFRVSVRCF